MSITDNMRKWETYCDQNGEYHTGIVSLSVSTIEAEADIIDAVFEATNRQRQKLLVKVDNQKREIANLIEQRDAYKALAEELSKSGT